MAGAGVTARSRQSSAIRVGADRVMGDAGCAAPQNDGSPALRTLVLSRAVPEIPVPVYPTERLVPASILPSVHFLMSG